MPPEGFWFELALDSGFPQSWKGARGEILPWKQMNDRFPEFGDLSKKTWDTNHRRAFEGPSWFFDIPEGLRLATDSNSQTH